VDIEAGGRTYRLAAVHVGVFRFLHIYGIAAKDTENTETSAA
jgi:hypothetical protein